jgi:excisionase family DNA binding protein
MADLPLHTIDEAAQLLQVSRSTIYRLIAAGEILAIHIGATRRIPHSSLTRCVETRIRSVRLGQS